MSPRTGFALASALPLLAVSLSGCLKAPQPLPPSPRAQLSPLAKPQQQVADLEARARALLHAQDEIVWNNWTKGAPLDLTAQAEQGKTLYSRDAIDRIRALRQTTGDPLEARALDQLRLHFEGEFLARALAPESAAISRLLATTRFKSGEEERPVRELDRLLAHERNALRRKALYSAAVAASAPLVTAFEAKRTRTRELLQQLGYPSTVAFAAELRRADLDALAKDAEHLLQETEKPFRQVLDQLATRELRLPEDRVRLRDIPRMFRSRDVDELFPADEIPRRGTHLLEGLGVSPASLHNLTLDGRDLPQKNPLPLALGIEIPGDVRFSYRPIPGLRAQSAYLHELGHSIHAALTRAPRFPLAKLGMGSVAEAWSQLFEGLVEDPVWLEQQAKLSGERQARYLSASEAWDLYLLRRAAGRYLYSLALAKDPSADPRAVYQAELQKALLVPIEDEDTARALLEEDEYLESASTLEARFLAAQLRAQLEAKFGPTWWEAKEAGDYLRPLWAHGNALDARELARASGAGALSPGALLQQLTAPSSAKGESTPR